MGRIDFLKSGPVKDWYRENTNPVIFDTRAYEAEVNGYELDPESGLLFRGFYTEKIQNDHLGQTVIGIIFPRPVDLHHHDGMGEAISIISGEGVFYKRTSPESRGRFYKISEGDSLFVPAGMDHSFRPDENDFLEVLLVCTGIYDNKKEKCVERFDRFEPWVKYYEALRRS